MPGQHCTLCGRGYGTGTPVHVFPNPIKFPERFKQWVNVVGGNLETPSDFEFYKKKRICDVHFKDEHKTSCHRLSAIAVPSLYLPDEPITANNLRTAHSHSLTDKQPNFISFTAPSTPGPDPVQDADGLSARLTNTDGDISRMDRKRNLLMPGTEIHIESAAESNIEPELEYDNEPELENDNESFTEICHDHEEDIIQSNLTHSIDEIDALFLSYAETFKKLSSKIQTMLKLDMAKLFSRYEMKDEMNLEKFTQMSKKRPAVKASSPRHLPEKKKKYVSKLKSTPAKTSVQNSISKSVSVTTKQERVGNVIYTDAKTYESDHVQDTIPDQTLQILPDNRVANVIAVANDVAATSKNFTLATDTEPPLGNLPLTSECGNLNFEEQPNFSSDHDYSIIRITRDVTS